MLLALFARNQHSFGTFLWMGERFPFASAMRSSNGVLNCWGCALLSPTRAWEDSDSDSVVQDWFHLKSEVATLSCSSFIESRSSPESGDGAGSSRPAADRRGSGGRSAIAGLYGITHSTRGKEKVTLSPSRARTQYSTGS
jgi:hypothetical protein